MTAHLFARSTADTLELVTRAATLASVDRDARTIEAVVSSQQPVTVYDPVRGELIDEILLARGCEHPDQVVFLTDHMRYGVDFVVGSVRNIRQEEDTIVGRLHLAADARATELWGKMADGHIRDVSAGYRILEYEYIEPGQSRAVKGNKYTAGALALRVTTRWTLREVSAVPIGADDRAKTRSAPDKEFTMPPELRAYLTSVGLRADATEADAWTFYRSLDAAQRTRADQLRGDATPPAPPAAPPAQPPATPPAPPATPPAPAAGSRNEAETPDAVRTERQRVIAIRALAAADVDAGLVDRAIADGWDENRAGREFWAARTMGRSEPVGQAPAGHVHGNESVELRREALAISLLTRGGIDPIANQRTVARWNQTHLSQAMIAQRERAAELADSYRITHLMDIVRIAAEMHGARVSYRSHEELFRAAFSGGTLQFIFTTSVNANVIQGFAEAPDTTVGMYKPATFSDFKTHDRMRLEKGGRLDKHPRGKTAELADYADLKESYKIGRFSKKAVIDEMDMIDDNRDVLMETPRLLGANARRLIPDIFYSILLANNAMADGSALFHANHANLGTLPLGDSGLKAGVVAMGNQRENDVPLNISPSFILCPIDLQFTAAELMKSATIVIAGDTDTGRVPAKNVLADLNLQIRADSRLGTGGCWDPDRETTHAGTATNWGLLAAPSAGPTIEIATLAATGNAPVVRSFVLDRGTWGQGWDVKFDVGGKAIGSQGAYWSQGNG